MSVYFATAGDYVKIGHSADPIARLNTITRNGKRPSDLPFAAEARLIGWIPGDVCDEALLHRRFADQRVAGEWFRGIDCDVLRDLIWADPHGIDIERMSATAVFVALRCPQATRDDIAAAGVRLEALSLEESHLLMDGWLTTRKAAS